MPREPTKPRKDANEPSRKNTKIDDATRERIIQSVFGQGRTVSETSKLFGFRNSTVQSVIRVFEETGRITALPRGGNRKRVLSDDQVQWIAAQIDHHPELTIERMGGLLTDRWAMTIPMSTMSRYITILRAGYTIEPLQSRDSTILLDITATDNNDDPINNDNGTSSSNNSNNNNNSSSSSSSNNNNNNNNSINNDNDNSNNDNNSSSSSNNNNSNNNVTTTNLPSSALMNDPSRLTSRQAWANSVRQQYGSMTDFCFVSITEFDAHCGHRVRALRGALSGKHQDTTSDTSKDHGTGTSSTSSASTSSSASKIKSARHHPILLVAMDKTGVVCSELIIKTPTPAKTEENFFLKKVIPLLATDAPGVLAIDLDRFQNMPEAVRQAADHAGLKIVTIPTADSPDFNAAHAVFRHVKLHVRQCDSQLDSISSLPRHVDAGLEKVTKEKAEKWIAEADRVVDLAVQGLVPVAERPTGAPAQQEQAPEAHGQAPEGQVPAPQEQQGSAQGQAPPTQGQATFLQGQMLPTQEQIVPTQEQAPPAQGETLANLEQNLEMLRQMLAS